MRIKGISKSNFGLKNNNNKIEQKPQTNFGMSQPNKYDSFTCNNISFKGQNTEFPYSLDTFKIKYPKDLKQLEELGSGKETVCRRSEILGYHHDGIKKIIEGGYKSSKLYNAFLDITLKYAKVKEEMKAPLSSANLLKQTRETILKKSPLPICVDRDLLLAFNNAYNATKPMRIGAQEAQKASSGALLPSTYVEKPAPASKLNTYLVERLLEEVDSEYLGSGKEFHEILKTSNKDAHLIDASIALVKGNHFMEIEEFMKTLPLDKAGKLSKRNNSIVLKLATELSKTSKSNLAVPTFVKGLLEHTNISDSVKNILKYACR